MKPILVAFCVVTTLMIVSHTCTNSLYKSRKTFLDTAQNICVKDIPLPPGFKRVPVEKGSLAEAIRNMPVVKEKHGKFFGNSNIKSYVDTTASELEIGNSFYCMNHFTDCYTVLDKIQNWYGYTYYLIGFVYKNGAYLFTNASEGTQYFPFTDGKLFMEWPYMPPFYNKLENNYTILKHHFVGV